MGEGGGGVLVSCHGGSRNTVEPSGVGGGGGGIFCTTGEKSACGQLGRFGHVVIPLGVVSCGPFA